MLPAGLPQLLIYKHLIGAMPATVSGATTLLSRPTTATGDKCFVGELPHEEAEPPQLHVNSAPLFWAVVDMRSPQVRVDFAA